jgi:hypothetical protein
VQIARSFAEKANCISLTKKKSTLQAAPGITIDDLKSSIAILKSEIKNIQ